MNGKGRQLKRDRSFDQNILVLSMNKLFVKCTPIDLYIVYKYMLYRLSQVHCFFPLTIFVNIFLKKFRFDFSRNKNLIEKHYLPS